MNAEGAARQSQPQIPVLDFARPAIEAAALWTSPVFYGWGVPRGDGHAVLVLPGLGGGDDYLGPMRRWLRRVGYRSMRSGLSRNPGWSLELVHQLTDIVADEARATGKPVSIIGHSMGGLIAHSIAARRPDLVRRVITLGAPLLASQLAIPANVPIAAIYSKSDPIVRYPAALAREPGARNIEVQGSHTGLAVNRQVYAALGELLAEKPQRTL